MENVALITCAVHGGFFNAKLDGNGVRQAVCDDCVALKAAEKNRPRLTPRQSKKEHDKRASK